MYTILWILSIVFQGILIIHAVTTGRNNWIWLLVILPGIGCLAYFWLEILPDPTIFPGIREGVRNIINSLPFGKSSIAKLEAEAEYSPTVANKEILADAYFSQKQWNKAVTLYQSCLTGPYQEDEGLLRKLAETYYMAEQYESAKEILEKLKKIKHARFHPEEHLLYAKTLQQLNHTSEALAQMKVASHEYYGLEPDYLYLKMLLAADEMEKARKQLIETKHKHQEMLRKYRNEQQGWMSKINREIVPQLKTA